MVKASKARVMVVEDEKVVSLDIKNILQRLGYNVIATASSGPEALKILENLEIQEKHTLSKNPGTSGPGLKPDVVLMDIILDDKMSGIETAQQVRTRFNIPVIYLTAYADDKTLEYAKATEPFGYILKPFGERELFSAIEMAVYKHGLEKELNESRERLKLFMNAATESFVLTDSHLNVIEINKRGLEVWGLSRKDVIGKNLSLFIPDLEESGRYSRFLEVVRTGKPSFEDEISVPSKEGVRCLNVKAFKVGTGLGIIATDITELKQTLQALRESEERYRMLFENMNEGFAIQDENGVIKYVNDKFLELSGYSADEVVGCHISELLDKEYLRFYEELVEKRKESGSYELVWRKKNGQKVYTIVSSEPVFDAKDNFKGSVAVLTDITERRLTEEELRKSREHLRSLSQHLQSIRESESRRIAREIHDELGQVLTALKMDVSWISRRLTKEQEALIEKTRTMSKLIDTTIKSVQRISAELRPGLLDDLGLIPAIEWQAQEFEERTKIKCRVDLNSEDIELDQGLSTAIFRIFQEGLTNVARHANATRVRISMRKRAGKLIFKIQDNGRGITEREISDPKSFGLLGIRERIYPWGGELKINGIPNRGTTLAVILPLKRIRDTGLLYKND